MNSWRPYPLLRLVIPFAAGICAAIASGSSRMGGHWMPVFLAILFMLPVILAGVTASYGLRWINGLLFNLFLVMAGYSITCSRNPRNDPDFAGNTPGGLFIISVAEPPTVNSSGVKIVAEIEFRREGGKWVRSSGNAVMHLKTKPGAVPLQFGDHVLVHAIFNVISNNSNPHGFNYAKYLERKGITHQVFIGPYGWQKINLDPSSVIRKAAFRVRDRLLDILRENRVEGREFAVAAALLLGYVDDLDAGLRSDYAATGAMHVLSVSGMHVGIIYIFLEFLLGFMNRTKAGRLLKAVILLVFIWFYALLTGLSPCVLRSAAMLSLPILGKSLNRSPDMYNIISASVLFILALDPFLILDVGFQLSYLAVTGIVVLYKPVYDLYVTSAWLPDKIWSVVAISIAAQAATLPITLYTFHQFPNYFMLTNIFVVPLSSLIIYTGILVLVAGAVPVVSLLLAKLLIFLVWLLNSVIHVIEQLPFSTIRGIYISQAEMWLLYLVMAALFLYLLFRRIPALYLFLAALIVYGLVVLRFRVERLNTSRLVVFNTPGEALYLFNAQDKAVWYYGHGGMNTGMSPRQAEVAEMTMHADGILYHRDLLLEVPGRPVIPASSFLPLAAVGQFMQFGPLRVAMLKKPIPKGFKGRMEVDVLILSAGPKVRIQDVIRVFNPGMIVVDATNSRFKVLQWLREARESKVHIHAVTINGAFQKDF
jgi:competence protein ComEC